jgi:lysophospholipase L1-like esterase
VRLYVIGDSISIHYGPYLETYLKGVMDYGRKTEEEEVRLEVPNRKGGNGGNSGHVLSFLEGWARAGGIDADILLLNCGLHDIATDKETRAPQVGLSDYRQNLLAILRLVAGMRCRPVWVRTTPVDDAMHRKCKPGMNRLDADGIRYNEAADEVMKAAGVPSIDLRTFTLRLGTPDELFEDGVHFHDHVRQKQAAFIAGWLLAFLQRGV